MFKKKVKEGWVFIDFGGLAGHGLTGFL